MELTNATVIVVVLIWEISAFIDNVMIMWMLEHAIHNEKHLTRNARNI